MVSGFLLDVIIDGALVALQTTRRGEAYERGDHLKVLYKGWSHHGIYIGGGIVIHLTGKGVIERATLAEFAEGHKVWVVPSEAKYEWWEIISRAESKLGHNGYNLLTNNCEHFANWCRSGRKTCRQLRRFL